MATIASLAVQLVADPTKFVGGLKVAEKAMKRIGSSGLNPATWAKMASGGLGKLQGAVDSVVGPIKGLIKQIPLIGSALASFPTSVGAFFEWFKEGSSRINEMRITSQKLGIPIERIAGFMMAAGPASESMAMSMLHLQKALGEATMKADDQEVVFNRLGLSAKELAVLPLDAAFGKIADKINGLATQTAKGYAAFSIFGKRGAELLPMLARGSAGIEAFQERAKQLGLSVSAVDAENVRQAGLAAKKLGQWMNAAKQSIAVELAPVVIALAEQFNGVGVSAKSVGQFALGAAKVIAYGGAVAVEAWKGVGMVWTMLKIGFAVLTAFVVSNVARQLDALAMLPDALGGDKFRQGAAQAHEAANDLMAYAETTRAAFMEEIASPSAFQAVDQFFDGIASKVEAAKKKMAATPKADPAITKMFELFERGQKVFNEMKNPLEKFQERIGELNELLNGGAISWETYERAVSAAGKALTDLNKSQEMKLAGSAAFGSQDAYSAIAKASGPGAQGGLATLKDAIKAQLDVQKRQQRDLDDIARAARGGFLKVGVIR